MGLCPGPSLQSKVNPAILISRLLGQYRTGERRVKMLVTVESNKIIMRLLTKNQKGLQARNYNMYKWFNFIRTRGAFTQNKWRATTKGMEKKGNKESLQRWNRLWHTHYCGSRSKDERRWPDILPNKKIKTRCKDDGLKFVQSDVKSGAVDFVRRICVLTKAFGCSSAIPDRTGSDFYLRWI